MIYDCFSFFNELSLLEIRLNELSPVVDRFVLVEATLTHSGKPKPLYYNENKVQFSEFRDKIIHVIVDDMPVTPEEIERAITPSDRLWLAGGYQYGDDWVRERFQRNAIMRAIYACNPDDIIIIEDADEIIRSDVIQSFEQTLVDGSNAIGQNFYMGYFNLMCTNMPWWGSKVLRRKFVTNPSEHRFHTVASKYFENSGWHFTYLGNTDDIKLKIQSYAHQEFNNPKVLDLIGDRLLSGKDVLGRNYLYSVVPLDNHPKYLIDNVDKFGHLIYRGL